MSKCKLPPLVFSVCIMQGVICGMVVLVQKFFHRAPPSNAGMAISMLGAIAVGIFANHGITTPNSANRAPLIGLTTVAAILALEVLFFFPP